ncbi:unnamed protein product [Urochloa decumbens]|uniref:F-box domain-containing protein n=1 Tax=Urochloa decumbens TaxID=240449 RepID=A0ABC9GX09_9POAL
MFDGMSTGSQEEQMAVPMETGSEDRISTLPDEIIHHLLGFLPAPEAVRTSLLAQNWRHHWKSMRSLRFTAINGPVVSAEWLNNFMAHLLRRPPCPAPRVRRLRRGLAVRRRVPTGVIQGRILDFTRCQALEDLVMFSCDISVKRISSPSLKRLRIDYCDFCKSGSPTRISVPNLIWLKLERLMGTSPVLESMPLLEAAIVKLDCNHYYNDDYPCANGHSGECCGLCEGCVGNYEHSGGSMLLQGLSSVTHLELTVPFAKFADTTCYPAFTKLKTLLLDEWCVAADFRALICILQHSSNLEKLTIGYKKVLENITELEGNDHPAEHLASVSENLKIVKVKCFGVDERVSKISKLFSAFDIQVSIE